MRENQTEAQPETDMRNGTSLPQRRVFVILFFLAAFTLFGTNVASAQANGEAIFDQKCASCHMASDEKSTGPGLMGVLSRIPKGDWKYKWVTNSSALIASGDAYANKIFKDYNSVAMTAQSLSNEEIDAVLAWADTGPRKKATVAGGPTGPVAAAEDTGSGDAIYIAVILLIVLILLISVLRFTRINLRNAVRERDGLDEEPAQPFFVAARRWMDENKTKVGLIGIFLVCLFVRWSWYELKDIGVYAHEVKPGVWKGYHPDQPIKFSHRIHAGDNKISCQYCHNTVEKSKTASIPSANVCMNCHKAIKSGAETGKEEIAKIYAAVGWDPEKMQYTGKEQPIQWVKVHNLADFVFFSHQQHVVVGKQECASCHGDVTKMDAVEQQRPLTMGWCVECHRTTDITKNMESNKYYERMHENLKHKYKDQTKFTVESIGGLECGRCHY
ncbi:MAG: cytochrome c class I [Bacteroidetes bacterium]|nr:MAG: cytochrome c class I [Bacteroidota bacterium]